MGVAYASHLEPLVSDIKNPLLCSITKERTQDVIQTHLI